jgi:ectoine hydroxylase-related dioxygenase (phytanoyl-CoA dioxygenase family)
VVEVEQLRVEGWALVPTSVAPSALQELRDTIFAAGSAGTRCLLDLPQVHRVAVSLKGELIAAGLLPPASVAVQAIAFDKTAETNWKVAWHQDLMFPFATAVAAKGYDLPSRKGGVDFARPPLPVLEEMLAVRLHLDNCDTTNGPLKICPGTHTLGLIPSDKCSPLAKDGGIVCLAEEGEVLVMKPLLLHASSQATEPKHRRVLHLVYHSGTPMPEEWHRRL